METRTPAISLRTGKGQRRPFRRTPAGAKRSIPILPPHVSRARDPGMKNLHEEKAAAKHFGILFETPSCTPSPKTIDQRLKRRIWL